MSGDAAPSAETPHGSTAAVCELLYVLARAGAWVGTHALADGAGVGRDLARRICRELAARDWTVRRADDGGVEQWRFGPAIEDIGAAWSEQLQGRLDALCKEQDLLALPLTPYRRVTVSAPPTRDELGDWPVVGEHHKGAAQVVTLVRVLLHAGRPASLGALVGATGLHRLTASAALDTLVEHGWVVREQLEGAALWRLGPGLGRLAAQHASARRSAFVTR